MTPWRRYQLRYFGWSIAAYGAAWLVTGSAMLAMILGVITCMIIRKERPPQ
jgi:hypothetical protein